MVVYFSYRQTIAAYPHGGGSYTVAKENLGTVAGLLAAAALMLDYVLVVAVGISAGVGALVSAAPIFQPYTLPLCLATLAFITLVNLRGVRESGMAFVIPTYLFVASLLAVLAIGIVKTWIARAGSPEPVVPPPRSPRPTIGASPVDPDAVVRQRLHGDDRRRGGQQRRRRLPRAVGPLRQRGTLTAIIALLAVLLAGIACLCRAYGIGATEPGRPGYESVLSQLVAAIVGKGVFYYVTIGSVLAVLALSANTGFADFPRLCRVIAQDGFLPSAFAHRGRRLVYSHGILVLAVLVGRPARPVRRDHRPPDPAVRRRRLPGVHALAGGDGRALAPRSRARARRGRWSSTAWGRSARRSRWSSSWSRSSPKGPG